MSKDGFVTLKNVQKARSALQENGCLLIEGAYSRRTCDGIISWMDSNERDETAERNYGGTELRIWDSQKRYDLLAEFCGQCDLFISCLLNADTEAYTLLAIRNRPIDSSDITVQIGRWHIDSFRRQYKIFLFLSDVRESTGPFEFISGTHSPAFKARMAMRGIYFGPKDLFSGDRRYSSLDDAWVNRIATDGYSPVPVLCSAGTVMVVDTSAIHRARPCFEGARYALTAYYH